MKSNKTPGIDGITSEFLKVFWGKIEYFVMEETVAFIEVVYLLQCVNA